MSFFKLLSGLAIGACLLPAQTTNVVIDSGYRAPGPLKVAPGQVITLFVRPSSIRLTSGIAASSVPLPATLGGFSVTLRQTFTFLHATSDGARIYEVRRGGSGPLIRRAFREEQLRGATLEVRLGGRAIPLRIALNGGDLARTEGGATVVRVPVPGDRIWSEANQVEIAALDGTTTVDLEDVTALAPPGVAAAFCR